MKTGLLLDDIFTEHDPGENHPEAPGRIKAIREQLEKSELISQCDAIPLRAVTDDEVRLAHTNGYLKTVITEIDGTSSGTLSTGDTNFGKRSLNVARNAAGGLLNAVDSVVKRETKNAFCAVRPPGHHATADRGMGFCIFNSAAIASRSSIGMCIMETAPRIFSSKIPTSFIFRRTNIRGIRERVKFLRQERDAESIRI